LLGILYVVVATALAHRYWEYPPAQLGNQYAHFLKNIAIIGGLLSVFVNGAGRFSIDRMLSGKD
jgi:putative oxidoreductase